MALERGKRQTGRNKEKSPLFKLGYLENSKSCLDELNILLGEEKMTIKDLNNLAGMVVKYYNVHRFMQDAEGLPVNLSNAHYKVIHTGRKVNSDEVVGWFVKNPRREGYLGITWGTLRVFKKAAEDNKRFRIGDLVFDKREDGLAFLEDIAYSSLPERWCYKHTESKGINYPILKSYIENIFIRLREEDKGEEFPKIIFSEDIKWMLFNSNLLDKYFHDILVIVEVRKVEGKEYFFNPKRSTSLKERRDRKIPDERVARPPKFFDNVNDVIFHPEWDVDDNFNKFNHIIEERKTRRFPETYKDMSVEGLAIKLNNAIKFAISLAQRNYKFVVPMYRPQTNSIQLLMPIYLGEAFQESPDFALVLTPDNETRLYISETILPLDAAYQNARLIAKPDETWLNPDKI